VSSPLEPLDSGILRTVRAEARRLERGRLVERLRTESARLWTLAQGNPRPGLSGHGRQSYGIDKAVEVLLADERGEWSSSEVAGQPFAAVATECDAVEVYYYDPAIGEDRNDELEPLPVRLVVCDGADGTKASAYLDLDSAEHLAGELGRLIGEIRDRRAATT